jgi:hypothetical protein
VAKQTDHITEIERKLNAKATRTELSSGLSLKADCTYVDASVKESANPVKIIRQLNELTEVV